MSPCGRGGGGPRAPLSGRTLGSEQAAMQYATRTLWSHAQRFRRPSGWLRTSRLVLRCSAPSPDGETGSRKSGNMLPSRQSGIISLWSHIIMESTSAGLLVLQRQRGDDAWTAVTLTGDDTLSLPEIGVEIPLAYCYDNLSLSILLT